MIINLFPEMISHYHIIWYFTIIKRSISKVKKGLSGSTGSLWMLLIPRVITVLLLGLLLGSQYSKYGPLYNFGRLLLEVKQWLKVIPQTFYPRNIWLYLTQILYVQRLGVIDAIPQFLHLKRIVLQDHLRNRLSVIRALYKKKNSTSQLP